MSSSQMQCLFLPRPDSSVETSYGVSALLYEDSALIVALYFIYLCAECYNNRLIKLIFMIFHPFKPTFLLLFILFEIKNYKYNIFS